MNWKNHPFDICLNLLTTIKEGWCVGLGQEGVSRREDGVCLCEVKGNCLKYLIRGVEWKRKKGKQILRRGGKMGEGLGALKMDEAETPL